MPAYAGTKVSLKGNMLNLMGEPLQVGQTLPNVSLPDRSLQMVDLKSLKGKVTILSVVPSLDTPTCEEQTHILSEKNEGLDQTARLVTLSRDLPFAQKRFAKEAKINNVLFLSDYRDAGFGNATGLLIEENRLLARAIMVLDQEGVIRYLEIVPELSKLPDMQKVFDFARSLEPQ
ncbi:MAG: putative thiol peroxidase [Nitrospinaceae bacterium]|nr:MAG: putative thiol peroxidase [Nitrospinaceae bacterium]